MTMKYVLECDSYRDETLNEFKARSERGCEVQATGYAGLWGAARKAGWTKIVKKHKTSHFCPICSEARKDKQSNG